MQLTARLQSQCSHFGLGMQTMVSGAFVSMVLAVKCQQVITSMHCWEYELVAQHLS